MPLFWLYYGLHEQQVGSGTPIVERLSHLFTIVILQNGTATATLMFQLEHYAKLLAQDSLVKVFQLEHFTHAVMESGKLEMFQLEHFTNLATVFQLEHPLIATCIECSNWNTCGNHSADVA